MMMMELASQPNTFPRASTPSDNEYWEKLYDMKAKYGNYLEDLRDRVKKFNDYEIERRIHILATLLYCTPETQNFVVEWNFLMLRSVKFTIGDLHLVTTVSYELFEKRRKTSDYTF